MRDAEAGEDAEDGEEEGEAGEEEDVGIEGVDTEDVAIEDDGAAGVEEGDGAFA